MINYETPIELFAKTGDAMREPLDYENSSNLMKQLSTAQSIRFELSNARCQWYSKLVEARERVRMPKDKEYTDLDRKILLEASTARIEEDYRFLLALEDIVSAYIGLGQTFLQSI
jgi:hypothetical protein